MAKTHRSVKPSQVADPDAEDDPAKVLESMIASYQPSATKVDDPVYQESRSETWNPKTGAFNVSIGWVYI